MRELEIALYLTYLVPKRKVATGAENQALNTLGFDPERGPAGPQFHAECAPAYGSLALWRKVAVVGMQQTEGQRCRFGEKSDPGS